MIWPDDMLPVAGGLAAIARSDTRPCRCGHRRFEVVVRRDGRVSVQCGKCVRRDGRVVGTIEVDGGGDS